MGSQAPTRQDLLPSARRKAYLLRVLEHNTLEDILSPDRKKQWDSFSPDDQKKIGESKVFVGFVEASGLPIDPLNHENEDPPFPDIRCVLDGRPYYFELGEIADQELAQIVAVSSRTGGVAGGAFSQEAPLVRMIREKCAKTYRTNSAPVDLVLYFDKQYPHEEWLLESLEAHAAEIKTLLSSGSFSRIWIHTDWPPRRVLWRASR